METEGGFYACITESFSLICDVRATEPTKVQGPALGLQLCVLSGIGGMCWQTFEDAVMAGTAVL